MCHYAWRSAFFLSAKTQRFLFPSLALGQKGKLSKNKKQWECLFFFSNDISLA
jgi:hypothetical protein